MREIRRPATRITCSAVSADWLCPETAEPPKIIAGTVAVSRGIPRVIARTFARVSRPDGGRQAGSEGVRGGSGTPGHRQQLGDPEGTDLRDREGGSPTVERQGSQSRSRRLCEESEWRAWPVEGTPWARSCAACSGWRAKNSGTGVSVSERVSELDEFSESKRSIRVRTVNRPVAAIGQGVTVWERQRPGRLVRSGGVVRASLRTAGSSFIASISASSSYMSGL